MPRKQKVCLILERRLPLLPWQVAQSGAVPQFSCCQRLHQIPHFCLKEKSFRYLQCCKLGKKERKQIFAQQLTFRFWFRQLHRFLWWRLIKLSQHPVYHRDAGLLLDRVRKSTKMMSNLKNISFCFGVHILTEGAL